ncbi:MAG: ABC-2 family transporter protein [Anaerolineales bacterium]|nr:ABC-2 family transporter protein [Anaerolineales bacterium]MCW5855054.1 ABC-2 family transporter protein [Anaerolineales bacterium]
MLRGFQLFGLFSRISILNEMQYRANFFIQVFQSALTLTTGLIVMNVVFSYTQTLGGWTHSELLAIYGVFFLMSGIVGALIFPNIWAFMEDVREGRLDFILTKPEDAQVLISVRQLALWRLVDVIIGVVVLAIALTQIGQQGSWLQALAFGTALLMGAVILYSIILIASTAAFWSVRVWEMMEMIGSIFQAGRWPVGIYPDWLRLGLTYLIPVAFAVTVPAEALTGRLTPQTLLFTFFFTIFLAFISRKIWFYGLKNYTGASA